MIYSPTMSLTKRHSCLTPFHFCVALVCFLVISCAQQSESSAADDNLPVASRLTEARASDGLYISWREHLIDGLEISGVPLSGSDGITLGDLDKDGYPDFVSVHESDVEYDGVADGYIRMAFGSADSDRWELVTLAEGAEAGAAEDSDIADFNGDGWPDIVAACELEHLIYFQNPSKGIRSGKWERVIPPITANRGSFIRVFSADFNDDGRLEVVAPNKGSQSQLEAAKSLNPISWFEIQGDPLDGKWIEHELARVVIPENSRPVDMDGDGDLDILGGSRGEERILWFENLGSDPNSFKEHTINAVQDEAPYPISGVSVDFFDFNQDKRLDIVVFHSGSRTEFGWLEQPEDFEKPWLFHEIGNTFPDNLIGLLVADINSDGNPDIMTGSYSGGPRDRDGEDQTVNDPIGRLAWFEHPGDPAGEWIRHDFSRRIRGMFDQFVSIDLDGDGDLDFVSTRGNSYPYDGVFWLEQVRTSEPMQRFAPARKKESREMGLPTNDEEGGK